MTAIVKRFLVLNGPNLNLLGERQPELYGSAALEEIIERLHDHAEDLGVKIIHVQSNHEGELIEALHDARRWAAGVIINPAALTHYSYALRDAIASTGLPAVEVHLTDIDKREDWRRISVTRDVCIDQIAGHGGDSYLMALDRLLQYLLRPSG